MVLDIITAALIVIPMGIGMAKGFLYIVMRLMGWVGAVAGGVFLAPTLRGLLEKSFIGNHIRGVLEERFSEATEDITDAALGLPSILGNVVTDTVDNSVQMMVNAMSHLILTLISFLMIAIMIRLVLILVIRPISKRKGKDPVTFMNKLLGLAAGGVEGLLLAFLFLAALIPVMQMSSPETAASIANALKNSHLAGALYDGNLLLAIFG